MNISDAILLARGVCSRRHLSVRTEKTYTHWLRRFGLFLKARSPLPSRAEAKIELFLTHLAARGASVSTQNQAFNALLVHLLYACGLRVTEPLSLRIKDVDLANHRLIIRQAKGKKDRVVLFPGCLAGPLARQLEVAKTVAAGDRLRGIPVPLPGLLDRKYPNAGLHERWAWLVPSRTVCRHPRTGKVVRWRCHEANIQRAVRQAAPRCGLDGVTPHSLRHAYATHALQDGALVHDLQVVLGHKHLDTTMRYLHAEAKRVQSPLQQFSATPAAAAGS